MPFDYVATTKDGAIRRGSSRLTTETAVIAELEGQGLIVISVTRGGRGLLRLLDRLPIGTVKQVDKLLFIKHLSIMLKSGLTLLDALKALSDQQSSRRLRSVLRQIHDGVEKGERMSDNMDRHPAVFSKFFVNVIRAGEVSGSLEGNLEHLAIQTTKDYELRRKVKSALMYPTVVFVAALLIGFFFATYVLPQVTAIFSGLKGVRLPLPTRILIAISGFAREHTFLMFLMTAGLAVFVFWFLRRKFLAPVTHYLTLRLPIVGPIATKVNIAHFAMMLGTLLKSGVDIVKALSITEEVMGNVYFQKAIAAARDDVQRGLPLFEGLAKSERMFPGVVTHMLEVGEQSGELEEVLGYLAEFYELEVDSTMKSLSSILEPVLLLFIGLMALLLAYAILIPIYNFVAAIKKI